MSASDIKPIHNLLDEQISLRELALKMLEATKAPRNYRRENYLSKERTKARRKRLSAQTNKPDPWEDDLW